MEAYLADDLWLRLARHANAMAGALAKGLAAAGYAPVWPVEANEVFVALPQRIRERLEREGARFYAWTTQSLPKTIVLASDATLVRLVTSFATSEREIERFLGVVKTA